VRMSLKRLFYTFAEIPFMLGMYLVRRPRKFRGSFHQNRKWYRVDMPKHSTIDGSKYYFYMKKGESDNLLINFMGGGVAWNKTSLAKPGTIFSMMLGKEAYYTSRLSDMIMPVLEGVLSLNDPNNPFDTWNVVNIPYATGDFHTGNSEVVVTDSKGRVKHYHLKGEVNLNAIMKVVKRQFPKVSKLVISGQSAGAFGCVAQGDNVASKYPQAERVVIIADGAQIPYPKWQTTAHKLWKTSPRLYECIGNDGDLIGDWFVRLSKELNATFLHINSPQDDMFVKFSSKMNGGKFGITPKFRSVYVTSLKKTVYRLTDQISKYRPFIAEFERDEKQDTTAHTAMWYDHRIHAKTPAGITFAEWIQKAIDGEEISPVGLDLLDEYTKKYVIKQGV